MGWGVKQDVSSLDLLWWNMSLLSQGGGNLRSLRRDTQDESWVRPCENFSLFFRVHKKRTIVFVYSFELNTVARVDHQWCRTSIIFSKTQKLLIVTQLMGFCFFHKLLYIFSITIHSLCWLSSKYDINWKKSPMLR